MRDSILHLPGTRGNVGERMMRPQELSAGGPVSAGGRKSCRGACQKPGVPPWAEGWSQRNLLTLAQILGHKLQSHHAIL